MSKTLLDLPPNITTTAQLATLLEDRIRDLNQILAVLVSTPSDGDVDLGANRIVNLGDPQTDLDGVNFRTLKRFQPTTAAAPATPSSAGPVSFRAVARGYAELSIEDLIVNGASGVDAIEFVAWAVDESDIGLNAAIGNGLGSAAGADTINNPYGQVAGISTDPALSGSRLGRAVSAGDFLYIEGEIVRVTAVGPSTISIARSGLLGSSVAAHPATALWFKLCPFPFTVPARPTTSNMPARIVPEGAMAPVTTSGVPTRWDFAAPNLCIVAIAAAARTGPVSGPVRVMNYTPSDSNTPAVDGVTDFTGSPGLRTCSGAAYTDIGVGGTLTAGGYADFMARVQAWHSIRNVYGYLNAAAGGAIEVAVLYYSPDRTKGGVIATIAFASGDTLSQPVATADGVQMPVGVWPPNLLAAIAMSGGRAAVPISTTGDPPVVVEAGGWLDIVVLSGSGAALTVVVAV